MAMPIAIDGALGGNCDSKSTKMESIPRSGTTGKTSIEKPALRQERKKSACYSFAGPFSRS